MFIAFRGALCCEPGTVQPLCSLAQDLSQFGTQPTYLSGFIFQNVLACTFDSNQTRLLSVS